MKFICWKKRNSVTETISNVILYAEVNPTTNDGCPRHEDTVCTNTKYCDLIIDACQ